MNHHENPPTWASCAALRSLQGLCHPELMKLLTETQGRRLFFPWEKPKTWMVLMEKNMKNLDKGLGKSRTILKWWSQKIGLCTQELDFCSPPERVGRFRSQDIGCSLNWTLQPTEMGSSDRFREAHHQTVGASKKKIATWLKMTISVVQIFVVQDNNMIHILYHHNQIVGKEVIIDSGTHFAGASGPKSLWKKTEVQQIWIQSSCIVVSRKRKRQSEASGSFRKHVNPLLVLRLGRFIVADLLAHLNRRARTVVRFQPKPRRKRVRLVLKVHYSLPGLLPCI
jgi:hypothetical protein